MESAFLAMGSISVPLSFTILIVEMNNPEPRTFVKVLCFLLAIIGFGLIIITYFISRHERNLGRLERKQYERNAQLRHLELIKELKKLTEAKNDKPTTDKPTDKPAQ